MIPDWYQDGEVITATRLQTTPPDSAARTHRALGSKKREAEMATRTAAGEAKRDARTRVPARADGTGPRGPGRRGPAG
ncbi:hemicentin-2 [Streptomyces azureus]|uniref:Hemicentin-2 n=1 Tax=Streptomyces azureus TaxID=146537 RepID=A0A0K8PJZ2_STRAJ|nr:hemicentin-2 [Streptomyces azureus]